jgi:hypothetical protein
MPEVDPRPWVDALLRLGAEWWWIPALAGGIAAVRWALVPLVRAVRAMAGADPERFQRMDHRDAVAWLRRTAQELQ